MHEHDTDLIPMTVPEVRRLLLTLAEPDERFNLRLTWSIFRRHHQGIAKRCHATRRSLRVRAVATQLTTTQLDFTLNSTCAPSAPAPTIQILCNGNWNFELDEERWSDGNLSVRCYHPRSLGQVAQPMTIAQSWRGFYGS